MAQKVVFDADGELCKFPLFDGRVKVEHVLQAFKTSSVKFQDEDGIPSFLTADDSGWSTDSFTSGTIVKISVTSPIVTHGVCTSGPPHGIGRADESELDVLKGLLRPFKEEEMCTRLDTSLLESLLERPLCRKVPLLLDERLRRYFPAVFEEYSGKPYAPATYSFFSSFCRSTDWKGHGEVISSGVYNFFITGVVGLVRELLNLPVYVLGDELEDSSHRVCTGKKGRNLRLICGTAPVFQVEYSEKNLIMKHEGSTACVYGDLETIFGYVSHGIDVQFLAIPLDANRTVQDILPKLCMLRRRDREVFMIAIVNILRWIRTLHDQHLLCSTGPGLGMLQDHVRTSPWRDLDFGLVTVNIGLNHVLKCFRIPNSAYADFRKLYSYLTEGLTGAVVASSVIVDGVPLFAHLPKKKPYRKKNRSYGWRSIELHLIPVGCHVDRYMGEKLVVCMVQTVLQCLRDLHHLGFCHYDVRLPNVMRYKKNFFLIDFELAGRIGSDVPRCFASDFWKQDCNGVYRKVNDLYMLGRHVIDECINSPVWLKGLGMALKAGGIITAEEALLVLAKHAEFLPTC